ncbi:MAG: hypothetical protein U0744_07310 [Gemmataceae bacterium]
MAETPLVLKLAALPRGQAGPFLILGVDKDSDKEAIESAWAQRLIWARKGIISTPLEDINWARELLTDPARRWRADAQSMNVDTTDGVLRKLKERFQGKSKDVAACKPIEDEKSLADYVPDIAVPATEEVRAAIALPDLPREMPLSPTSLVGDEKPIDPWEFYLPEA